MYPSNFWKFLIFSMCSKQLVIKQPTKKKMAANDGEIPVFLACPDVDPMHSPKIGYSFCSQWLVSK